MQICSTELDPVSTICKNFVLCIHGQFGVVIFLQDAITILRVCLHGACDIKRRYSKIHPGSETDSTSDFSPPSIWAHVRAWLYDCSAVRDVNVLCVIQT